MQAEASAAARLPRTGRGVYAKLRHAEMSKTAWKHSLLPCPPPHLTNAWGSLQRAKTSLSDALSSSVLCPALSGVSLGRPTLPPANQGSTLPGPGRQGASAHTAADSKLLAGKRGVTQSWENSSHGGIFQNVSGNTTLVTQLLKFIFV